MELEALKGIFEKQNRSLVIGALKSHIGHSEGAAGILSCVKALLCVSKAAVPPNLHLIEVVKGHDWALIPSVFTPLTPERKMRTGISSFGFGGTICHVIMEHDKHVQPVQRVVRQRGEKAKKLDRTHALRFHQGHPLLGDQLESQELQFSSRSDIEMQHWQSKDHQVNGRVVFPAEAYLEMKLTVARLQGREMHVEDVSFLSMLALPCSKPLRTRVESGSSRWLITVSAGETTHATGHVRFQSDKGHYPAAQKPTLLFLNKGYLELSSSQIYDIWPEYGASYWLIDRLQVDCERCVATASLLRPVPRIQCDSCASPAGLLDAALQVLAAALLQEQGVKESLVPSRIGSVYLSEALSCEVYEAFAWWERGQNSESRTFRGHVELLQDQRPVATLLDCQFHRAPLPKIGHRQAPAPLDPIEPQALVPRWEEVWPMQRAQLAQAASSNSLSQASRLTISHIDTSRKLKELDLYPGDGSGERVSRLLAVLNLPVEEALCVQFSPCLLHDVLAEVEFCCQHLLGIAQALSKAQAQVRQFIVVTAGAVPVEGFRVRPNLAHSALTGMCRALRAEKPKWNVMQFDLEDQHDITHELPCPVIQPGDLNESVLVSRGEKIFGLRLQPLLWEDCQQGAFSLTAADHFLITGGLGGRVDARRISMSQSKLGGAGQHL